MKNHNLIKPDIQDAVISIPLIDAIETLMWQWRQHEIDSKQICTMLLQWKHNGYVFGQDKEENVVMIEPEKEEIFW